MSKFLVKFILFLTPVILAYAYVEYKLSGIPNSYNQKRAYFEKQLDSIEVLQLGASHSVYGVNPDFFSLKGFNLSNVSQSIFYDSRLTARYIERMPKLKLIIVCISYGSFREQLRHSAEEWREYYYYCFWGINDPGLSWFKPERYSKISLYTIQETKEIIAKKFRVNLAPELQYNGFEKNDSIGDSSHINDASGAKRKRFLDKGMNASHIAENFQDLKSLLSLANQKHIKVVFITTPAYSSFYKFADPAILHENDSLVNVLCKTYDAKYFNYFTDARFAITDFYDNDHLNYLGAQKFSKILDSEVIRPTLKLNLP